MPCCALRMLVMLPMLTMPRAGNADDAGADVVRMTHMGCCRVVWASFGDCAYQYQSLVCWFVGDVLVSWGFRGAGPQPWTGD